MICADDVAARAREAQERLGFEQSTTDWRQVATHPDVDVVSITTPNYLHLEMIRAAAEAKKHVFCEKPVGCSGRQTADIAGITRRAGVLTWVGYNYRWAPLVQYARQLIADEQARHAAALPRPLLLRLRQRPERHSVVAFSSASGRDTARWAI